MLYCSCGQALSSHSVALFGRRCIPCYLKNKEAQKAVTAKAVLVLYNKTFKGGR